MTPSRWQTVELAGHGALLAVWAAVVVRRVRRGAPAGWTIVAAFAAGERWGMLGPRLGLIAARGLLARRGAAS